MSGTDALTLKGAANFILAIKQGSYGLRWVRSFSDGKLPDNVSSLVKSLSEKAGAKPVNLRLTPTSDRKSMGRVPAEFEVIIGHTPAFILVDTGFVPQEFLFFREKQQDFVHASGLIDQGPATLMTYNEGFDFAYGSMFQRPWSQLGDHWYDDLSYGN